MPAKSCNGTPPKPPTSETNCLKVLHWPGDPNLPEQWMKREHPAARHIITLPQCIIRAVPKTPEAAMAPKPEPAPSFARFIPFQTVPHGNDGSLSKYLVFALNQHSFHRGRRARTVRTRWYLLVGIMRTEGFIRNILYVARTSVFSNTAKAFHSSPEPLQADEPGKQNFRYATSTVEQDASQAINIFMRFLRQLYMIYAAGIAPEVNVSDWGNCLTPTVANLTNGFTLLQQSIVARYASIGDENVNKAKLFGQAFQTLCVGHV
uniref:Uncharacterized protein n=1 Tax=Anopheles culicifacies TaxID=139723 RepID=A0A182M6F2_9DIPT